MHKADTYRHECDTPAELMTPSCVVFLSQCLTSIGSDVVGEDTVVDNHRTGRTCVDRSSISKTSPLEHQTVEAERGSIVHCKYARGPSGIDGSA